MRPTARTLGAALVALALSACGTSDAPAGLFIAHPDDAAKRVEYFIRTPAGQGPWPMVLLLHGHQERDRPGGRDFVEWGVLETLAGRGYLAVAVSQPGYGNTDGPADFSGPFTQHAVAGVVAHLRTEGVASPTKLVIEGISRGALTAGLVAAGDSTVSGLVLISGVYDLPAYVADPDASLGKSMVVRSIREETGGAAEALQARSVLAVAGMIRASALILNGARDDRTDPAQARALADAIVRSGGRGRAIIYPDAGHNIPVDVRNKDIDPFIDDMLGASRR